jgi:Holliday junction resolvase RusA-like endonuclease
MTRRDKWMQRRCVLLYRAWADQIRAAADRSGPWPQALEGRIHVRFWLSFPKTYRPRRRVGLIGAPHRSSPDADNLLKGIADALFEADGFLWHQTVEKYWDDGQGPRAEIELR